MTRSEIRTEVDYQIEESELDESSALENVADAAGIPWRVAADTLHCRTHVLECSTDDHR